MICQSCGAPVFDASLSECKFCGRPTNAHGGRNFVPETIHQPRQGTGAETYPNGSTYVGEWKDGKWHGKGTLTMPEGATYVGEFKNGKRDGSCELSWTNGRLYVGEFKEDRYHGIGTWTWPNGEKYVGEFKDWLDKEEPISNASKKIIFVTCFLLACLFLFVVFR